MLRRWTLFCVDKLAFILLECQHSARWSWQKVIIFFHRSTRGQLRRACSWQAVLRANCRVISSGAAFESDAEILLVSPLTLTFLHCKTRKQIHKYSFQHYVANAVDVNLLILYLSFQSPGRANNCHLVGYVNKKLNRQTKTNKRSASEMSGNPRVHSKPSQLPRRASGSFLCPLYRYYIGDTGTIPVRYWYDTHPGTSRLPHWKPVEAPCVPDRWFLEWKLHLGHNCLLTWKTSSRSRVESSCPPGSGWSKPVLQAGASATTVVGARISVPDAESREWHGLPSNGTPQQHARLTARWSSRFRIRLRSANGPQWAFYTWRIHPLQGEWAKHNKNCLIRASEVFCLFVNFHNPNSWINLSLRFS